MWRFNGIKFKEIHNNIFEIKWFINIHWESVTTSKNEDVGSNLLGYIEYCPSKDNLSPWFFFLQPLGLVHMRKLFFIVGPLRRNVFSQHFESLKWIFFMSNGVTLITFFSFPIVGCFTPMGINSNDFFQFQWGALQVMFSSHLWGVISSDFFFPTPMGG